MKHTMNDICFLAVAAFATAVAAHGESPTIVTSPASQTVAAGEGVSFEVSARNCDDFSVQLADGVSLEMAGVEPGQLQTHGFWIGKREVTQAQYEAVMGENPSTSGQGDNLPVDGVTWLDERVFCAKLTAREKKTGRTSFARRSTATWMLTRNTSTGRSATRSGCSASTLATSSDLCSSTTKYNRKERENQ